MMPASHQLTIANPMQGINPRLGIDSLLLAAFVLKYGPKIKNFVELGVGDGVAACTIAYHMPNTLGLGVDIIPSCLVEANKNATTLNVHEKINFVLANIQQTKQLLKIYNQYNGHKLADVVIANPPYHEAGTGRLSPQSERNTALHAKIGLFDQYCAAANTLLKHHGHFFCINSTQHLPKLLQDLQSNNFGIKQLLSIHSHKDNAARWILIDAQKNAKNQVSILPSLYLHDTNGSNQFNTTMLEFCPWIAT